MRTWCLLILSMVGLWGAPFNTSAAETNLGGGKVNATDAVSHRRVFVIPIRQDIEPPLVYIVRRGVKEAMEAKADLIVLDMDTNGGRISTMEEIIKIIENFKGETVTYVHDRAFSAGALIAVATQKIYMAPQSVIGAAAPIMLTSGGEVQDLPSTYEAKMNSAVRALVRTSAQKNGYNVDVVEAMIDKNKEVTIDGQAINKKGEILTLTDTEAAKQYGKPPKPLLSSGTVGSMDDLLEDVGYAGAQQTVIAPKGVETFASWLNAIGPVLLIIGMIGLYIEFKTPGVIVPGAIAALAFVLYFLGGYIAGLSGMEWIIVFVLGLALILSEFFLHPGTILPGVIGLVLVVIALVMAGVDMYPGTPMVPSLPQLTLPLENLGIAVGSSIVIALILARFLPHTPIYRTLVSQGASGVATEKEFQEQEAAHIGQIGVAVSNLRPGGKARFGERVLDVITQGEMIAKGQPVRVLRYSGAEAVVELAS